MTRTLMLTIATLCLIGSSQTTWGQIFSSDLDDATGWAVVAEEDTEYQFGFDYSPFGIPSAPNGTGTTGLRMAANLVEPGAAAAISAYPTDLSLSGKYRVEVDMWLNYNTSGGTTEAGGVGVAFDSAAGAPINGAAFSGNTDGDSSNDYQLFVDGVDLPIDSGQYAISSKDNTAPELVAKFPGQTTPAAQGEAPFNPANTIVTAPDGTLGYGWHVVSIDVDTDAGTARFAVDDLEIGTIDTASNPELDLDGTFAMTFRDPFNSVSNRPEFSFGVFDNVTVTQIPEPTSAALALLGLLGVCGMARRRS